MKTFIEKLISYSNHSNKAIPIVKNVTGYMDRIFEWGNQNEMLKKWTGIPHLLLKKAFKCDNLYNKAYLNNIFNECPTK